jgi:hypothetical protein
MSFLQDFLQKLVRLPAPQLRRNWFIPIKVVHFNFRLENDADYLCYKLFGLILAIGTVFIAFLVFDVGASAYLLVDRQSLARDKFHLLRAFPLFMALPVVGMSVLFYLRARIGADLRFFHVPILAHKQLLLGGSRGLWFLRALGGTAVGIACIFLPQFFAIRFISHYGMQNSLGFTAFTLLLELVGIGAGTAYLVGSALLWEKTIRFFPQLQTQLETMVAIHKADKTL